MSKYGKPTHKAVARSLGYALTLCDRQAWDTFCLTAYRKLSLPERLGMAYGSMMALPNAERLMIAEAVCESLRPDDLTMTDAFVSAAADYRRNRDRRAA